jgi:hypothetical protein
MTQSFRGAEWYDFSGSHISLSFTIGGSSSNFPSYPKAKKADGSILDFDVFSPNRSEAELSSQDTSVAIASDADFTDCINTSGFIPA